MNPKTILLGGLAVTVLWVETAHAADHRLPHHHEETPTPGGLLAASAVPAATGVATLGGGLNAFSPSWHWSDL